MNLEFGWGLDFEQIRERVVAKGLMTSEEANEKLPRELCDIVFQPGFSTRDRADAISGRGLGLDIVRKGIASLGGTIKILSTSHHGTSFEIRIPLNPEFEVTAQEPIASNREEHEEKTLLLDELIGYLARLARSLQVFKKERTISAAYEAYRLVHSIKGAAGFLGWNRVGGFCHHYEDLLKLIAEEKSAINDWTVNLVLDAGIKLSEFCEASRHETTYSLFPIRRLEAHILQIIWSATQSDERTHFYFGKYHLLSVEKLLKANTSKNTFSCRPESDFAKAIAQPFGALVQFNGDRRGYAGILMPEETFTRVISPYITGTKDIIPVKSQIWTLAEFANLMGNELSELAGKAHISLQPSTPITYYGWGQPLKILGNPTYCYACEINGNSFYLAGDFRTPQEMIEKTVSTIEPSCQPNLVIREAMKQCEKHFAHWNVPLKFDEISTQSDLVGFDGGITAIISCLGQTAHAPNNVLFLSYEGPLAEYVHQAFSGEPTIKKKIDLYDVICETSNVIGGMLIAALEKQNIRLKLSLPTVFVGKAYVANFNRLFVTNKFVAVTPHGRLELQILVIQNND